MNNLNKNLLQLISSVSKIGDSCAELKKNPTEENGENIIKIIEDSEKKFLTVKEDVVRIVKRIEEQEEAFEVQSLPSDNGYLLTNSENRKEQDG